jgi:hypothetical protein
MFGIPTTEGIVTSFGISHTGDKADCQRKIPSELEELFDSFFIMCVIRNINEGLESGGGGNGIQWEQKWASPFHFLWALSTSHGDLECCQQRRL